MNLVSDYMNKNAISQKSNKLFWNSPTQKTLLICHAFYSHKIIVNDFLKNSKSGLSSMSAIVTSNPIEILKILNRNKNLEFNIFDEDDDNGYLELNFKDGRVLLIIDEKYIDRFDLRYYLGFPINYIGYDDVDVPKSHLIQFWNTNKPKIKIVCELNKISKFLFDEFISHKRYLEFMGGSSFINSEV